MFLEPTVKDIISQLVENILTEYKNRDPFFLARKLGIEYRFVDLTNEVLAFSERSSSEDHGTIYINQNLGSYSQKILCAHELGHLCLHADDDSNLFNCDINPNKEYEANYFTVLLLPQIAANIDVDSMSAEELNSFVAYKIAPPKWSLSINELM